MKKCDTQYALNDIRINFIYNLKESTPSKFIGMRAGTSNFNVIIYTKIYQMSMQ
jgi:hypothetical protein